MMTHKATTQNGGEMNLSPATEIFNDAAACKFLSVTSRTLRLWRSRNALPHIRITAKSLRYRRKDLEQWLDRRRVQIAA